MKVISSKYLYVDKLEFWMDGVWSFYSEIKIMIFSIIIKGSLYRYFFRSFIYFEMIL